MWFWVGQMRMIDNPGASLNLVAIGTVLLCGILAAVDATMLGGPSRRRNGMSPGGWATFILLLWIVGYPMYMAQRKWQGGKSLLGGALLVSLPFLGISGLLTAEVFEKEEKIDRSLAQAERAFEDLRSIERPDRNSRLQRPKPKPSPRAVLIASRGSKGDFRAKVVKLAGGHAAGIGMVEGGKESFRRVLGKPDRTSEFGDSEFWHYRCTDGTLRVETSAAYRFGGPFIVAGIGGH